MAENNMPPKDNGEELDFNMSSDELQKLLDDADEGMLSGLGDMPEVSDDELDALFSMMGSDDNAEDTEPEEFMSGYKIVENGEEIVEEIAPKKKKADNNTAEYEDSAMNELLSKGTDDSSLTDSGGLGDFGDFGGLGDFGDLGDLGGLGDLESLGSFDSLLSELGIENKDASSKPAEDTISAIEPVEAPSASDSESDLFSSYMEDALQTDLEDIANLGFDDILGTAEPAKDVLPDITADISGTAEPAKDDIPDIMDDISDIPADIPDIPVDESNAIASESDSENFNYLNDINELLQPPDDPSSDDFNISKAMDDDIEALLKAENASLDEEIPDLSDLMTTTKKIIWSGSDKPEEIIDPISDDDSISLARQLLEEVDEPGKEGDSQSEAPKETKAQRKQREKEERERKKKEKQENKKKRQPPKAVAGVLGVISGYTDKFKKKFKESNTFRNLAIIGFMSVTLIISGLILYFLYNDMTKMVDENKIVVKQSGSKAFNNSNYLFVECAKPFNDMPLTITKLLLDEYMSAFYFKEHIDMKTCFAELRDNNDNFYAIDKSLMKPEPKYGADSTPSILWFDGLRPDAKELFLTVYDLETGDNVMFEIDLVKYNTLEAKYMDKPVKAAIQSGELSFTIEKADFSSAVSSITYKMEATGDYEVIHGKNETDNARDLMMLENDGRAIAPLLEKAERYKADDNLTIGRMVYNPLRSLDKSVNITFTDLNKLERVNTTVSAEQIFTNARKDQVRIDLYSDVLVLERMKKMNGAYLLVYHVEDKKTGIHRQSTVDIDMYVQTYSGLRVYLKPEIHENTSGGDILFWYDVPNPVIENMSPKNVFIDVKSVNTKLPDISLELDVAKFPKSETRANEAALEDFVVEAFSSRLAVKSKAEDENILKSYFSELAISSPQLKGLYEPAVSTEPPGYGVNVKAICSLLGGKYMAVVDESWIGKSNGNVDYLYKTHYVIIEPLGNNYVISSDNVIN